jgi:hypothetical protein
MSSYPNPSLPRVHKRPQRGRRNDFDDAEISLEERMHDRRVYEAPASAPQPTLEDLLHLWGPRLLAAAALGVFSSLLIGQ